MDISSCKIFLSAYERRMALASYIALTQGGTHLDEAQSRDAFRELLDNNTDEAAIASFLLAIHGHGITISELVGAASAMRERMIVAQAPEGAVDVCGTGGDNRLNLNVSTAVSFVLAACGVPVAKHGNRAVTSASGSTDVLAALGIVPQADAGYVATCFERAGICFFSAPDYHPALRRIGPIRKKLGTRTIFNLLGPLCNPAGVKHQLTGVYDPMRVQSMAQAIKQLGGASAWVVHGGDGSDELSISGTSVVAALRDNTIRAFELPLPDSIRQSAPDAIRGGDADHNAAAMRALLSGEHTPYRDAVLLNTGAALVVAGKQRDIVSGMMQAAEAIDSGKAAHVVNLLLSIGRA